MFNYTLQCLLILLQYKWCLFNLTALTILLNNSFISRRWALFSHWFPISSTFWKKVLIYTSVLSLFVHLQKYLLVRAQYVLASVFFLYMPAQCLLVCASCTCTKKLLVRAQWVRVCSSCHVCAQYVCLCCLVCAQYVLVFASCSCKKNFLCVTKNLLVRVQSVQVLLSCTCTKNFLCVHNMY